MRAIIFGVDGLTFRLLHPLIERGDMPNFARLQREGVEAIYNSTVPPMTPCAWMSLSTGLHPSKHGVFDFWEFDVNSPTLESKLVTHRKAGKAIWNILSEYGKKVIVLNVPVTYPPDPVNGIMVSGLMTPSASAPFTYPTSFKDELYEAVPGYRIDLSIEKTSPQSFMDIVLDMTEKRIQLQDHLLSQHDWDFAFLSHVGPDRIQHRIWDALAALDKDATKYFRLLDDSLGRAMSHLTPDDVLFVASDHGFVGARKWFYINEFLRRHNYLHQSKAGESRRSMLKSFVRDSAKRLGLLTLIRKARKFYASLRPKAPMEKGGSIYQPFFEHIDWRETHACVLSSMAFSGGNADIVMSPHATKEEKETLKQLLLAERDPKTGEPLLVAVHDNDSFGDGPFRPKEEHLILIPHPDVTFHLELGRKDLWEPTGESKGVHETPGVFYAWGSGIKQGVKIDPINILDLVPTTLQALGLTSDEPFDGRAIQEVFTPKSTEQSSESDGESLVARKLRRLQAGKSLA